MATYNIIYQKNIVEVYNVEIEANSEEEAVDKVFDEKFIEEPILITRKENIDIIDVNASGETTPEYGREF